MPGPTDSGRDPVARSTSGPLSYNLTVCRRERQEDPRMQLIVDEGVTAATSIARSRKGLEYHAIELAGSSLRQARRPLTACETLGRFKL